MEETEHDSSPTKPKNSFNKRVWVRTSLDKERQVSVINEKFRALLEQAIGRVQLAYPDASTESKDLLFSTSAEIMKGLSKASQLQVLDPFKLEKKWKYYKPLLQQTKRKREEMEENNYRGKVFFEELVYQHEQEDGQES